MIKGRADSDAGYTLVEVGMAMAIGALIFLAFFLALPTFQRNMRDSERKADVSKVVQAVTEYNANRPGYPLTPGVVNIGTSGSTVGTLSQYVKPLSGQTESVSIKADSDNVIKVDTSVADDIPSMEQIWVIPQRSCGALTGKGQLELKSASSQTVAVVRQIEAGATGNLQDAHNTGAMLYCETAK